MLSTQIAALPLKELIFYNGDNKLRQVWVRRKKQMKG